MMFRKRNAVLSWILATFILFLFVSCGDDNPVGSDKVPALTTASVSAVTHTTAECGGTITSEGAATVTARGVCWSTSQTPTVTDNITVDGAGTGSFTSSITGLTATTTYYVRAYATNSAGTGYGSGMSFTTEGGSETGTVTDIDGNTYQTIKIGNQWWMAENLKVTRYRNGDAIPEVTVAEGWSSLTIGAYCYCSEDVTFAAIYGRLYNGLAISDGRKIAPPGWHVPSYAEWRTLVDYLGGDALAGGKMKEGGTTHWATPNTGATNESGFTALPGGGRASIYDAGPGFVACFWSSTMLGGSSAWYLNLRWDSPEVCCRGISINDGYSVRCVRNDGPVDEVPVLTTAAVSAITQTTAQSGGTITSDGIAPVTARGVCWSTNATPTVADNKTTDGSGLGSFTSSLTGLTASTTYNVRAYATNSAGTGYGSPVSFETLADSLETGTVTDIDGNIYQTVKIGDEWWMAENLKVTHYRNGDAIPNVTEDETWSGLTTGAYCNYDNNVTNVATYGRLYNWYSIDDSRNIAPAGWHVPSDVEWDTLVDYLGGVPVAGGKMKESGTSHWATPNTGATNESGFSALPSGYRAGSYHYMNLSAIFWSSTENHSYDAWARNLYFDKRAISPNYYPKHYGFSVRCVKD